MASSNLRVQYLLRDLWGVLYSFIAMIFFSKKERKTFHFYTSVFEKSELMRFGLFEEKGKSGLWPYRWKRVIIWFTLRLGRDSCLNTQGKC
jgi:predicted 3-demethylubiquinone-9 3-methyltransferase (glyoxalase superfamily)